MDLLCLYVFPPFETIVLRYLASVNQCQYFNVHTSQDVLSTWEQYQIFFILLSKYGKY